jgi:hypothetical protein
MSGVRVEVSARKVTVPYLCPCCCGVADTALAVSFTRITGERLLRETTRELDFPYCTRCVRHSSWWTSALRAAVAVMACGAIASVVLGLAVGAAAGLGAAVFGGGLAVLVGLALRAKARAGCSPSCAGPGTAVTYHGWVDQVQTFSFVSRRYAAAFAEENGRSLVNVTPLLYQLVEQQRVSTPAQAPAPLPSALAQANVSLAPTQPPLAPLAPVVPLWPQRVDRARDLLDNVMQIDRRAIGAGGVVKRPRSRAS